MHAVLGSGRAGTRTGVHQGVPDRLPEVRYENRDARAAQLREHSGFAKAGVYDPPSIGGTHVVYVLHDATRPELYGGLPSNPIIPPTYTVWKSVAKPIGLLLALLAAPVAFFHYIVEGPKEPE